MAPRTKRAPDQGTMTPERFIARYAQELRERGPANAEALWEWRYLAIDYDAAKRRRRLAVTPKATDDIDHWLFTQRTVCILAYLSERETALSDSRQESDPT